MDLEEIKNSTIRSVVALTGRTIFLQILSAISFFLLGIFLSPSAIGVFIVVSAVLRIFTLFSDIGFGASLIQKKEEPTNVDLGTAFTQQIILVFLIVLLGYFLTPIVVNYSHLDQSAVNLYHILLVTLIISTFKMIPSVLLERKLAFEKQVIPQIVESITFNFLVVLFAYLGWGLSSYSWSILISSIAGLPIYYLVSPWKIRLGFSKQSARELIGYGLPFQGKNILAIFKDDLLTFFLSGQVGSSGVGYWGWAQRWSYFPFRFIVDSLTKVTFPAYSRMQADSARLKIAIEKSIFAVSSTLFPILTLMAIVLPSALKIVPRYAQWQPAIISFYFLCAGAAVSSISNILVNALDATGRIKTTLSLMILWISLTWVFTISFVHYFGFTGISIASFVVTLTIFLTIYLVKRVVNFQFVRNIYKQVVSCLIMGFFAYISLRSLPTGWSSIIVASVIGGLTYFLMMMLLARKQLMEDLVIIRKAYLK